MNIVEFNNWLLSNGSKKKAASDTVCRLKRINNELLASNPSTSVDEQFKLDGCKGLLNSFNRKRPNKLLHNTSLPLDKPEIANYKSSLNKYLKHLNSK